jgi:hypothetical protein
MNVFIYIMAQNRSGRAANKISHLGFASEYKANKLVAKPMITEMVIIRIKIRNSPPNALFSSSCVMYIVNKRPTTAIRMPANDNVEEKIISTVLDVKVIGARQWIIERKIPSPIKKRMTNKFCTVHCSIFFR